MKHTEDKLRKEIFEQLQKVSKKNCPKIYEILQTADGYLWIEDKIINMLINERLTPSACIPHIESELI